MWVQARKEEKRKRESHVGLDLGQQILRLIRQMGKTKQKLNLNWIKEEEEEEKESNSVGPSWMEWVKWSGVLARVTAASESVCVCVSTSGSYKSVCMTTFSFSKELLVANSICECSLVGREVVLWHTTCSIHDRRSRREWGKGGKKGWECWLRWPKHSFCLCRCVWVCGNVLVVVVVAVAICVCSWGV